MKLYETIDDMKSDSYKLRFQAEYYQLVIRFKALAKMLEKWDNGTLDFMPACPRSTYNMQIEAMANYIAVLEARACIEGVELSDEI